MKKGLYPAVSFVWFLTVLSFVRAKTLSLLGQVDGFSEKYVYPSQIDVNQLRNPDY